MGRAARRARSIDARVGDWLDWLTGQVPGAVVFADSPAAYPYLAAMTNPLVARVAGVHLNHLTAPAEGQHPAMAAMTPRFAERFADQQGAFDALVVLTEGQAEDLRTRFGADTPTLVIPPAVARPAPSAEWAADPSGTPGAPLDGPGARRIVAIGPLDAAARHDHVLRAAQPALLADGGLTLDLVGDGDAGASP